MGGATVILAILEFIVIIAVMARIDAIYKQTKENNEMLKRMEAYFINIETQKNYNNYIYQNQNQNQNINPYK